MQECFGAGPWSADATLHRYEALQDEGDCHASAGRNRQARLCYRSACDLAPEKSGAYVSLGVLAVQDGKFDEARRAFDIARHLDPACPEAYGGLAMVFHESGELPAAFEMYLKCLELDTDNLLALLGLFQTSCQMGTFEQIIHYLEVYLRTHSDDTAVLFCLATLHAREGKLQRAGKTLRDVLEIEPDNIEAAKLLAQVTKNLARLRPPEALAV